MTESKFASGSYIGFSHNRDGQIDCTNKSSQPERSLRVKTGRTKFGRKKSS